MKYPYKNMCLSRIRILDNTKLKSSDNIPELSYYRLIDDKHFLSVHHCKDSQ